MPGWVLVALGGVLGTVGRFAMSDAVNRASGHPFPFGTLAVNTLGCALAGFLATYGERKLLWGIEYRMFWMVGLLGAFTTFSALIFESWRLLQAGHWTAAFANLLGSVALGFVALAAGVSLARFI